MKLRTIAAICGLVVAAAVSGIAAAQSAVGFGATVVIPIVANTASYTSEVWVGSGVGNPDAIEVNIKFYEANTSATPGAVYDCTPSGPLFVGANGRAKSFQFGAQCALPGGSRHGMLVIEDAKPEKTHIFSAYSRVQNPQAIGFSVEGFPIGSLSPQSQNVTGLKRVLPPAAIPFQSNCFVGALGLPANYEITLYDGPTRAQIGSPVTGSLAPYQMKRHSDIFAEAGLPTGDYSNVAARIRQTTTFTPGNFANPMFVSFCTVQDNVSFGADFRMGKSFDTWDRFHNHFVGTCTPADCGAYDLQITDLSKKQVFAFTIRPPDNVKCDLVSDRLDDLEMALGSGDVPSFTPFLAGGDNQTGFYYQSGPAVVDPANGETRRGFYALLVSAREKLPAPTLPIGYAISCRSGNGGTMLDLPFEFADDF